MDVVAASVLREARRRSGMSQAELARRARLSQSVISAYESGSREPGVAMLVKLVEAAGQRMQVDVVPVAGAARGLPDTSMGRRLRRRRKAVIEAAKGRGATNVRVFGSVARGDDTASSDVDLLVDLDADVGLVALVALERELRDILGREVDVVPAASVKSALSSVMLAEAIPL